MKGPFWMISSYHFKIIKQNGYSYWYGITLWIKSQWYYFKRLYFTKCDNTKSYGLGHFLNSNGYCLRCKNSKRVIDMMRRLKK